MSKFKGKLTIGDLSLPGGEVDRTPDDLPTGPGMRTIDIPVGKRPKVRMPEPVQGMVIHYDFRWHSDFIKRHESDKPRPCLIMFAGESKKAEGKTEVIAIPITHTAPNKAMKASTIKIPKNIGRALGLDDQQSYLRCNEVNIFEWPSADLRPVPSRDQQVQRFDYGLMDEEFFEKVKKDFVDLGGRKNVIRRDRGYEPEDYVH